MPVRTEKRKRSRRHRVHIDHGYNAAIKGHHFLIPLTLISQASFTSSFRAKSTTRATMQFNDPTYRRPRTVPEREYPAGVIIENSLRVWAISRWRGPRELARFFLQAGYSHLPPGTPPMFHLHDQYDGNANGFVIGLYVPSPTPTTPTTSSARCSGVDASLSRSRPTTSSPTSTTSSLTPTACTPSPTRCRRTTSEGCRLRRRGQGVVRVRVFLSN